MSEETNVIELEPKLQEIADQLDGLTLLEASKLVKSLAEIGVENFLAATEVFSRVHWNLLVW